MPKCTLCNLDKSTSLMKSKIKCRDCFNLERRNDRKNRTGKERIPSQCDLVKMFSYDPATGLVYRILKGGLSQNSVGTIDSHGYLAVQIKNIKVYVHRLVWKMVNGNEPETIDHINGVRSDNRVENLRAAKAYQNCSHRTVESLSELGFYGVYPASRDGTYRAFFRWKGVDYRLGVFSSVSRAVLSYNRTSSQVCGEFSSEKVRHNIAELKRRGLIN